MDTQPKGNLSIADIERLLEEQGRRNRARVAEIMNESVPRYCPNCIQPSPNGETCPDCLAYQAEKERLAAPEKFEGLATWILQKIVRHGEANADLAQLELDQRRERGTL